MKKLINIILILSPLLSFGQAEEIKQLKDLMNRDNCEKSIEIIDDLIKNKQANNLVFYYKSWCEWRSKDYESSIKSATVALQSTEKSDSLYAKILQVRSFSYSSSGKLELGIKDNEFLVNQFPDNLKYLLNMSYLYGENLQFYKCLQVLTQAHKIDSLDVSIINNLAYYNTQVKDYKSAILYAQKGLALTKDSSWIAPLLNSLGFAQAKIISADKGLKTIRQSLSYMPNNSFAYFNIALIYLDKKETEEACENFNKARELGGTNMTYEYLKKYCK